MPGLRLNLLGDPRLEYGGENIPVKRRKAIALLAYLALSDQPQGRDTICALLWPEQDKFRARRVLRSTLAGLAALPVDCLERVSDTLALNREAINVDVSALLDLIARRRAHTHPASEVCEECEPLLGQAADLYRADFLAGFSLAGCPDFEAWQTIQREWLQRELSQVLARLVTYYRTRGNYEEAFRRAFVWLHLDKLHEPAYRELMRLYAVSGRRAEALRQYQQCVKVLDTELGVIPEDETTRLYHELKSNKPALAPIETLRSAPLGTELPKSNLPVATTPFIGRRRELEDVKRLLGTSRLLTLTGTGGTGKTRLALRVAEEVEERYPEGVYFVDLAPLSAHTLVANAVAGVLGVAENVPEPLLNTLKRALAQRTLLLLIDNFEHVIAAGPLVSELLSASANLRILVTSRESLRLAGEQEYFVPPLSLPDISTASGHSIENSEAVSLFVQRVQLAQPHFEMNDTNAPAITRICTRLDGLPLAIELAAARCKLLTPQAVADRLEAADPASSLGTLTAGSRDAPPRHRTLRDTMSWSYELLEEKEKQLFARLAVFRGGRSLEAIAAVCGDGPSIDVLDGLASLVDKSLVQQKKDLTGEPRFVLLEMINAYARERLEAGGEADSISRRHAEYFVALAERADPELRLARYAYWYQRLELEVDNFRAALDWALGPGDIALGVRLAGALGMFWYSKGYHVEGIRWTQLLLERLDETPTAVHTRFLIAAGRMAFMVNLETASRMFARALETSRNLDDRLQEAWALVFQGYITLHELDAGMAMAETSLSIFRELDHPPGIAQALNIIGELARMGGDYERAKRAYEECLAVCQQTGEVNRICYTYANLAYVAHHEGDHKHALQLARQALQLSREVSGTRDVASFLANLASPAAALGQLQPAARLLGASEAALERLGAFHQPTDKPEVDHAVEVVRAQLDAADFEAAWAEGRAMTVVEAIDYAGVAIQEPLTKGRP